MGDKGRGQGPDSRRPVCGGIIEKALRAAGLMR